MPLPVLKSYVAMMPRLRAQRLLDSTRTTAAGTGSFGSEASQQFLTDLQRIADATRKAKRATPVDLAALPIGVKRVPTKKKESPSA